MSLTDHRKIIPVNRRIRPQQPSHRSNRQLRPRRLSPQFLRRCNSDPTLGNTYYSLPRYDDRRSLTQSSELLIYRRQTSLRSFCPLDNLLFRSPPKFEGYNRDAKVVVNVTVEGSPGPVRAMLKLESTVEETIRLVVNKYSQEGRSPRLDRIAASNFELHPSHFSLQSLNKSDMIGEAGSRSFYLRMSNSNTRGESGSYSFIPDNISVSNISQSPPLLFLPAFISRRIDKLVRRTKKLWKIMGCMPSGG